jgi:hypothetical protein
MHHWKVRVASQNMPPVLHGWFELRNQRNSSTTSSGTGPSQRWRLTNPPHTCAPHNTIRGRACHAIRAFFCKLLLGSRDELGDNNGLVQTASPVFADELDRPLRRLLTKNTAHRARPKPISVSPAVRLNVSPGPYPRCTCGRSIINPSTCMKPLCCCFLGLPWVDPWSTRSKSR